MIRNLDTQQPFIVAVSDEELGVTVSTTEIIYTPSDFTDAVNIFEPRPPWHKICVGSDLTQNKGVFSKGKMSEMLSFTGTDVDLEWLDGAHPDPFSIALIQFNVEAATVMIGVGARAELAGWQMRARRGSFTETEIAFYVSFSSGLE